jgi:hypothetical protein
MSSHRIGWVAAVFAGTALAAFLGSAGAGQRAQDAELTLLSSTSNRGEIEPCG